MTINHSGPSFLVIPYLILRLFSGSSDCGWRHRPGLHVRSNLHFGDCTATPSRQGEGPTSGNVRVTLGHAGGEAFPRRGWFLQGELWAVYGTIFRITAGFRSKFHSNRLVSECRNKLFEEGYWKDFKN